MTTEKTIQLTQEQGQALVRLARETIANKLEIPVSHDESDDLLLQGAPFHSNLGTFVTLKINDRLRGCIGNITSPKTLTEGVKANAVSAAFNDYRFSPLSRKELSKISIEVSVLTEPVPLEYSEQNPLPSLLTPHVDGIIIHKGEAGATFLPQVWKQLPDPESFLTHLCMKAGLSPDEWKSPGLKVLTYKVQYFSENCAP